MTERELRVDTETARADLQPRARACASLLQLSLSLPRARRHSTWRRSSPGSASSSGPAPRWILLTQAGVLNTLGNMRVRWWTRSTPRWRATTSEPWRFSSELDGTPGDAGQRVLTNLGGLHTSSLGQFGTTGVAMLREAHTAGEERSGFRRVAASVADPAGRGSDTTRRGGYEQARGMRSTTPTRLASQAPTIATRTSCS